MATNLGFYGHTQYPGILGLRNEALEGAKIFLSCRGELKVLQYRELRSYVVGVLAFDLKHRSLAHSLFREIAEQLVRKLRQLVSVQGGDSF